MVSACYRRLAMDSAHAVHILMMFNLRIIGIAIRSHRFLDTITTRPTNYTYADEVSVHTHDRASALSVARWRAECMSASSQVTRQVHVLVISFGESDPAPFSKSVINRVFGSGVASRCTTVGLMGLYLWDLTQRDVVAFELLEAAKGGIDDIVVLDMAKQLGHEGCAQEALLNILMASEAIVAREGFAILLDVPARVQDHTDTLSDKIFIAYLARLESARKLESQLYRCSIDASLSTTSQIVSTIAVTIPIGFHCVLKDEVVTQTAIDISTVLGEWVFEQQGPSGAFQGQGTHRRPTA